MLKIHTEIILDAPLDRVRELLADTTLYPQWNPLFTQVTGSMEVGTKIDIAVHLPEIKPFTLPAIIRESSPGIHLCWRHSYRFPGLFSWTYRYDVEEMARGRVRFIQDSCYAGLLAPLFYLGMKKSLQIGIAELNKAVQRWGERRGMSCLKC